MYQAVSRRLRVPGLGRICYTLSMFIHRVFITGRSDRGAWPWRKPVCLNT